MYLNCDMGEHEEAAIDQALMPYIDQASIACGRHAGNEAIMKRTLQLARHYQVAVGAHPSYDDREGFGRRSVACSEQQLNELITAQLADLNQLAASEGVVMRYVKPHGALYNDMMANTDIRQIILAAVAKFDQSLSVMMQATLDYEQHQYEADQWGVAVCFEAFADRAYADNGLLLARTQPNAVLSPKAMLEQVDRLCNTGAIKTVSGHSLKLKIDSLCVHGDNPAAVKTIAAIRERLIVAAI